MKWAIWNGDQQDLVVVFDLESIEMIICFCVEVFENVKVNHFENNENEHDPLLIMNCDGIDLMCWLIPIIIKEYSKPFLKIEMSTWSSFDHGLMALIDLVSFF